MPQDLGFLETATNRFIKFHNFRYTQAKDDVEYYTKYVNYFKDLIKHYSNSFYSNPFTKEVLLNDPIQISPKSIEFIETLLEGNMLSSILKENTYTDIIKVYIRGFIKNYIALEEARNNLKYSAIFKDIPSTALYYIIRVFYNNVEKSLLRGHSFRFNRVEAYLKIVRKSRKKKKYGNAILRKTEDWGKSMKFLVEQSKSIDSNIHDLYVNKRITKRQFMDAMKPHLYSAINKNGLKWIFYSDREDDAWLIISHKYSSIPQIRFYGITPKNDISTADQSQIKFTDECDNIDQIIETKLLGLRDKIRALERFDPEYCKTTFKLI